MRQLKITGTLVTLTYLVTFGMLTIVDEKVIEEMKDISVTAYNFEGMPYRQLINIFGYVIPGGLIGLFSYRLQKYFKSGTAGKIGAIILLVSGLSWLTLGIYGLIPNNELTGFIHLTKVTVSFIGAILGLILLSSDVNIVTTQKSIKIITLGTGLLMLAEIVYTFSTSYSGIVANISWTIYFLWFIIFSWTIKEEKELASC